jgi:hypothetical protein
MKIKRKIVFHCCFYLDNHDDTSQEGIESDENDVELLTADEDEI